MALPTASDSYVNPLVSGMAIRFDQDESKFVHNKVFPEVMVDTETGNYATFDRGDLLRDEAQPRGATDEVALGGYGVDLSNTYNLQEFGFGKLVSDKIRRQTADPLKPDEDAARFLIGKKRIKMEVDFFTNFFATGIWGTDVTGGTDFPKFTDVSADPIDNIQEYMETVEGDTGQLPNFLLLSRPAWRGLKNNPDVRDRYKHTSDSITTDMVAAALEIDNVYVAAAVRNTAQSGATAAVSYIAGNNALLGYAADAPSVETPSGGYTFVGNDEEQVSTLRIATKRSDLHEINFEYDPKLTSSVLGVFMSGVV